VEGLDVGEAVLLPAVEADGTVRAAHRHVDVVAEERGEGVLQPHAELADDAGVIALLVRLVLREVLVAQAPPLVADVPGAVGRPLDDRRRLDAHDGVLVEGVGDDLPQRVRRRPVLEDLLDIQVERVVRAAVVAQRP
jgi:hypothetical protein